MKKISLICATLLACVGPPGQDGPQGSQGPAGAPGMIVTGSRYCAGSASGYTFFYQWVTYSTGDGWTSCEVAHNTIQYGYSNSIYLKANLVAQSLCFVLFDIDAPSSGSWGFTRSPSERVTYSDPASPSNNFTYVFVGGECN